MGDARTALMLHARTLSLMGVDVIPVSARSEGDAAPVELAEGADRAGSAENVLVEPKSAAVSTGAASAVVEEARGDGGRGDEASGEALRVAPLPRLSREEAERRMALLLERYERDAPHRHFVTDHHTIVFGDGDPTARLMFIGEAPGAEEDRVGRPFVGRAGQLLDKMIVAMGLTRESVYIANVLKTRPPNNATPTLEESRLCAPYLFEQIAIVRPEVIVTLGLPASRLVLDAQQATMGQLRGRWGEFRLRASLLDDPAVQDESQTGFIPVMPTYHPAFLLRSYTDENRRKVWDDLQKAMQQLGLTASGQSGG